MKNPPTQVISVVCKSKTLSHSSSQLSAVSPCWSGLGGACSHWCGGRGICWFVRRPVGLEPPAPGRWTPAWRGAARRRDQPQLQLPLTPPHPAPPLGRTHAGRKPGGQNRWNVLKKMVFKCVSLYVQKFGTSVPRVRWEPLMYQYDIYLWRQQLASLAQHKDWKQRETAWLWPGNKSANESGIDLLSKKADKGNFQNVKVLL